VSSSSSSSSSFVLFGRGGGAKEGGRGSNSMVNLTFFFLAINRSGPKTSSTTNHIFYRTLGWLHGPWWKQPLTNHILGMHFTIEVSTGVGRSICGPSDSKSNRLYT
jgi:hypothetical protein